MLGSAPQLPQHDSKQTLSVTTSVILLLLLSVLLSAMRGTQHLLLLAEFVLLARCQQKPQVKITPRLKQIFSGDLLFLSCDKSTDGSGVKWYFDDMEQTQAGEIWKIGVASPVHSGSYQCEHNGEKSDGFSINVLDYAPSASLIIKTGQPVVRTGGSVVLQLDNEDGLQGWTCWVHRGGSTRMILLRLKDDSASAVFQPHSLNESEAIFWCTDSQQRRSNQIMVRTSEKDVSLEMYPLPAVVGESLTLKCLVWGTDQISYTVFYKENAVILEGLKSTYKFTNVTEAVKGIYKCDATYTYRGRTSGLPYHVVSDEQDVFVQAPPMKAVLSANIPMACSCPLCTSPSTYRWYYKKNQHQPWALMDSTEGLMTPKESGTYACRVVWKTGRSFLSNGHIYASSIKFTAIAVVFVVVILVFAAVFLIIYYKKRNTTVPIYEDVPMRSRDIGDDKYEALQMGAQRGGDYDTLQPEAPGRQKKEGDGKYEVLQMGAQRGGDYDTLQPEAPGRQKKEGEYEALNKEAMPEAVYHSLKMEGAAGSE